MLDNLINDINSSPLLYSLISSVVAGLFIASLFSIIYPRYLLWLKRARLDLVFPFDQKKHIKSKAVEGTAGPKLELAIENNGFETLDEMYWHIFMKSESEPIFEYIYSSEASSEKPVIEKLNNNWWHCSGMIKDPMFPKRKVLFPYKIGWEINSLGIYPLYFYFVTRFGLSPSKAEKFNLEFQLSDVDKYLDKIVIELVE